MTASVGLCRAKLDACRVKGCPAPESAEWHTCWLMGHGECFGGISHQHTKKRSAGGKVIDACLCMGHHDKVDNGLWGNAIWAGSTGHKVWWAYDENHNKIAQRIIDPPWWRDGTPSAEEYDAPAPAKAEASMKRGIAHSRSEAGAGSGTDRSAPARILSPVRDVEAALLEAVEPSPPAPAPEQLEEKQNDGLAPTEVLAPEWGDTALVLPEEYTFEEAEAWVGVVKTARTGNQWWAGDLMNALEDKFPGRATQLDHTDFGYTPESLANAMRVCAAWPKQLRNGVLAFGHHALTYANPDRDALMDLAEAEGMSVAALRRVINGDTPKVRRFTIAQLREARVAWDEWADTQTTYRDGVDGFLEWLELRGNK